MPAQAFGELSFTHFPEDRVVGADQGTLQPFFRPPSWRVLTFGRVELFDRPAGLGRCRRRKASEHRKKITIGLAGLLGVLNVARSSHVSTAAGLTQAAAGDMLGSCNSFVTCPGPNTPSDNADSGALQYTPRVQWEKQS